MWMERRHNWDVKPEWLTGSHGVVNAIFLAIRAFSSLGDGVIIMPPVYYPFYKAIELNNRKAVKNPLINTGSRYLMDFEDLEKKAKDPDNKILLFCSPHNPVGRVWTAEELKKVGEICLENDLLIISDEIHFDIIMPGYQHTVFATLSEELASNMIVCTAPSKTFNLAGLQTSNIIIPAEEIRERYNKEAVTNGTGRLNILGYKACEIVYRECEGWLDELIELLYYNHQELKKYIKEHIPAIKVYDLEGTYLQWLDFRSFGLADDELEELMHQEAELF